VIERAVVWGPTVTLSGGDVVFQPRRVERSGLLDEVGRLYLAERDTELTVSDDVATRFVAYGWNIIRVADANDLDMLARAFRTFAAKDDRSTLIIVDSHIAYWAPKLQDTSAAPASPWVRRRFG